MSSIGPHLMQFVWIATSLLGGALMITSAALFLHHRGVGPWIMMITACLSLLIGISHQVVQFIGNSRNLWGEDSGIPLHAIMQGLSLIGSLSWILFAAGLLITAVRLRGISRRSADLESIINARDLR